MTQGPLNPNRYRDEDVRTDGAMTERRCGAWPARGLLGGKGLTGRFVETFVGTKQYRFRVN